MCFGWVFALLVAMLPLVGVNSYYKYAVCLPFDIAGKGALAYASGLMLLNGFAFVVIVLCYISIYCAIQGSLAWNCNDSRVALRMSLLVFTDFICWAPIAFFSLTAAFNLKHVSLHTAKILTVFVLPVNSCANPFLYTILTKQFKEDCYMILRCFRSENAHHKRQQTPTPGSTPQDGAPSLRNSLSHLVFPSCCRSSSSASHGQDPMSPRSRRQYVYQREVHTHCKKTRFHARLLQPADDDLEGGRRRSVFPECGCFAPFWKNQRFSRSQEDVSLKNIPLPPKCKEQTQALCYRGSVVPWKRRSFSYPSRKLLHWRKCKWSNGINKSTRILFYSGRLCSTRSSSGSAEWQSICALDGEESESTDNVTSSSSKFTIISVEVTKEFEHPTKTSKSTRPSDLRVDCSPPQKPKLDRSSPTLLSSPSFQLSDCSSPATLTEYWSPSCSPGLSPTYSPGLCPEILVTKPETSSCSLSDESLTEKLGESIV